MKALSLRQAQRCETAKHPTCKCRCGGALHGAFRTKDPGEFPSLAEHREFIHFFSELPDEDPHHIDNAQQKKEKTAKRAVEAERRLSQLLLELHNQEPNE